MSTNETGIKMMKDGRILVLGIERGISILLISFFHVVSFPRGGLSENLLREAVWLVIPFFFLVSGFCNEKNLQYPFKRNIVYRIKRLLFPTVKYTMAALIIGGIYFALFHGYTFHDWFRDVIDTFLRPEFSSLFMPDAGSGVLYDLMSSVWFIWTMMYAMVLFYAVANFSVRNIWTLSFCCIVLLGVSISVYDFYDKVSWSLTLVPMYSALMLCGLYLNKSNILSVLSKVKYPFAVSVVLFAIHFLMFLKVGTYWVFMSLAGNFGRFSVITFFLQTFLGGCALTLFSFSLMRFQTLSKILMFIGDNSLVFLILHRLFGAVFSDLLGTFIRSGEYWDVPVTPEIFVKSFLTWIGALLCCGGLCYVTKTKNYMIHQKNPSDIKSEGE